MIHGDLYFRGEKKTGRCRLHRQPRRDRSVPVQAEGRFSATATLQRSVFGMKRYAEVVGENIELRFEIEGIRDGDAAKSSQQEGKDGAEK